MVLTEKQTEKNADVLIERPVAKSYFGSISVDTEEEPLFEIEKEYNNFERPQTKTKGQVLPEFEVLPEKETKKEPIAEVEKDIKLSTRGKILAIVASLVTVLLLTLVIYNAVILGAKRSEIAALNTQLEASTQELAELQAELQETQSEDSVASLLRKSGSSLRKATNADKVTLELENATLQTQTSPTNWFDKLCEFLSGLFR